MITEAEAKQRWCPFVRAPAWVGLSDPENAVAVNRGDAGDHNCVGSACMAWRYSDGGNANTPQVLYGYTKEDIRAGQYPQRTGYCGLAGAPR